MEQHTICLLNDSFPPLIDGVANAVVNYAENIEKHYGHALVVTPSVAGADDSCFNFPVLRYPSIDTRKTVGYVTGYPYSPEVAYRVRQEGTELLHLHCPVTSAFIARQLRESMGVPLIMTYHTKFDIDIANMIHGKLLQGSAITALLQNIKACDEVWAVSRGAGENLRSLGYEGDYIIMENGVDLTRGRSNDKAIEEAVSGYDLPAGVPVFLFIGRLMWYKGIRIILDALAFLKEKNIQFRMVFIGDGGDKEEICKYTDSLKLDNVCFFTGAISDRETLRSWYSRADLFLFPSTFDTNGLVVREAAACSLPTVMVMGSCAAEGVIDGHNGFLIEENAASMASRLEELCASFETIRTAGECAADELYISWEDAVKHAADRYETVLENFKLGHYTRKPTLQDSIIRLEGESMNALGELSVLLNYKSQDLHAGLVSGQTAAMEKIRSARAVAQKRIAKHRTAVWEYLDRYL